MNTVHVLEIGSCRGHQINEHHKIPLSILEEVYALTKDLDQSDVDDFFEERIQFQLNVHDDVYQILYTLISPSTVEGTMVRLIQSLKNNVPYRVDGEEVDYLFGRSITQASELLQSINLDDSTDW